MIRAFSRWLFMRTHRHELKHCAAYARGTHGLPGQIVLPAPGQSIGMIDALDILGPLA